VSALSPRQAGRAPRARGAALAGAGLLLALAARAGMGAGQGHEPFVRLPHLAGPYAGPGREEPAPAAVSEVRLGWFGPGDPADPLGGLAWAAALMAVDDANATGGLEGAPFRLLPCWSENPWRAGVAQLARLIYEEGIWALIGSVTGDATHLAEQVIAKARVAMVSPFCTDKSVNLANVSWTFSLAPPDDLLAPAVVRALADATGAEPFVLLSATGHDARLAADEFFAGLRAAGLSAALHLTFAPGSARGGQLALQLDRILAARPRAVVVIAAPPDAAGAVKALRAAHYGGALLGWADMGRTPFIEEAGTAAEGVRFPFLFDSTQSPRAAEFAARFAARAGRPADYTAALSYDAASLLVAAVRSGGLNRARIRDALAAAAPWEGIAGRVSWDLTGRNRPPVVLGTVREGAAVCWRGPPEAGD